MNVWCYIIVLLIREYLRLVSSTSAQGKATVYCPNSDLSDEALGHDTAAAEN